MPEDDEGHVRPSIGYLRVEKVNCSGDDNLGMIYDHAPPIAM